MCGIFGYFGSVRSAPTLRNSQFALSQLDHRGPDAHGLHWQPNSGLVLGHARLSILDPDARSDQPFRYGENWLVFNGEIYNFQQLRAELQSLGATFSTSGDTEVIAIGYAYWGERVFDRLLGMFALALYDGKRDCLHLARDDFGIKPLCILMRGNEVVFASEIKSIAALRSLSLNGGVLSDMLSWGFQMDNVSLYDGVRYLPPGGRLCLSREDSALRAIQRTDRAARNVYFESKGSASSGDVCSVVEASVNAHMIADVPVAIALSGGLDSSIVAAVAAQNHSNLHAYTFTLSDDVDAEVEHAQLVCQHLGVQHHIARLLPSKKEGWLRRVAWHLEEPIANINALLGYGLAGVIRDDGFKVVLVGEGSDEVFGGYPWYGYALDPQWANDPGGIFDAYRKRRALSRWGRFLRPETVDSANARLVAQRDEFANWMRQFKERPLDGFLGYDLETQLQYSQLLRVDRMYMAHGIEARVPFLYRPVLETASRLPFDAKLQPGRSNGRTEKIALADAFQAQLPERVAKRPKFGTQGTVNVWDTWLSDMLEKDFDRVLYSAELRGARQLIDEFVDWKSVSNVALSSKEKFSLALLLESVDCMLLSKAYPEAELPVEWELLS